MKNKIIDFLMMAFGILIAVIIAIYLGNRNLQDTKENKKAERVIANLKELRIAIEKYYQLTQTYPELSREGAYKDLKILDYKDKDGNLISFAKIYKHNEMPMTEETNVFKEKNIVFDRNYFENGTETGGWNYDYSTQTGEIHANLIKNAYGQGINWAEY